MSPVISIVFCVIVIVAVLAIRIILIAARFASRKTRDKNCNRAVFRAERERGEREKEVFTVSDGARAAESSYVGLRDKSAEAAGSRDEVSPVHYNCDHARKPSAYTDVEDTCSMTWDEFKTFMLKLFSSVCPSARISPYKYRGSPDIQLTTKDGAEADVRLIQVSGNCAVSGDDFSAAADDTDGDDDVEDWIVTNGRFTVAQRASAASRKIRLIDGDELRAMIARSNALGEDASGGNQFSS